MSQQHEMEFADLHVDGPEASYRGYHGPTYQEEHPSSTYQAEQERVRLALQANPNYGINPTFLMQMRLGLIIVSLILWVIVFFGSIIAIVKVPGSLAFILYPLVFLGLGLFTVLVVLSNLLFRRR